MDRSNVNTLWGQIVADELTKAGIETAIIAPGSRSTPLTLALVARPEIKAVSLLDERSAAFFALGYAKRTGRPAPLVCTSGTALANFHPAVVEADAARVPMILLTADRPPELTDSGANQTIDQERFYGETVRYYRKLPEPEAAARKLRSLRTALSRGVETACGTDAGPIHFDVPFRKPLEPNADSDDVPAGVPVGRLPDGVEPSTVTQSGRTGPYVSTVRGRSSLSGSDVRSIAETIETAESGLIVCGPSDQPAPEPDALLALSRASGFPVLADPLSGHRFGPHVDEITVCGGYDGYISAVDSWPEVVIRFGASPTSKSLRNYLRAAGGMQFLVDPVGEWREATFSTTDLLIADETGVAFDLAAVLDREPGTYAGRLAEVESAYWTFVEGEEPSEGAVLADVVRHAPDPATIFVSNSMPVRDLDRFGAPRPSDLSVLGNRGASGIDGIVSSALGAGFGTDDSLVLVTGDLAYYHDMNGLLAVDRANVDATIVSVNNDGGGIFHRLPIEDHDGFEPWFRTPHGLDFEHSAAMYGLEFARTNDRERFCELYVESIESDSTQVIELTTDAERSHETRRSLERAVAERIAE